MSTRHLVIAAVFLAVLWDARVARAQLSYSHLAARDGGYVFVQTISTRASRWAEVEVNNADGSRKCEWLKKLDAKQTYRFECPVTVAAGDTVPSRVRLYKDAKLEDRESFNDPVLTVTASVLTAAIKVEAAP
jgi:hypothetical protein